MLINKVKGVFSMIQGHGITIYGDIEFTGRGSLACESPVTLRDITLGVPTVIGAATYISGPVNLRGIKRIGRFCSLGNNINFGPGNHPVDWLSTNPFQYNAIFLDHPEFRNLSRFGKIYSDKSEVEIGNDVWVGSNVTVMRGVKIGDGAIIAAGSIVTNDVPAYGVVGGIPAKIIKYRFNQEIINKLLELSWWDYDTRCFEDVDFDHIEAAIDQLFSLKGHKALKVRSSKWVHVDESFLEKFKKI